ncbi:MAG TPA: hypothetical protein VH482_16955 [Thermomicrobiales bacterium]
MAFQITWAISDRTWERAVEGWLRHRWDDDHGANAGFYYLIDRVQICADGTVLFPADLLRGLSLRVRATRRSEGKRDPLPELPPLEVFERGYPISLIDFAATLAHLLGGIAVDPEGTSYRFRGDEGCQYLIFTKTTDGIEISSSVFPEIVVNTHLDDFLHGTREFLLGLASEIEQRAPELFDWKALAPLRDYRDKMLQQSKVELNKPT